MANLPLRYVIIGCAASIAPAHFAALSQIPEALIVGMSDIDVTRGATRAVEQHCEFFLDYRMMLAKLQPDIAIICTPHPLHAKIAVDCFTAGAHVLTEKPLAVEVAEGDTMIAAAEKANRLLAVNFQQRFRPAVNYAKRLLDTGAIGSLVRVLCVEPWFRTDAYYRSARWRSTWNGEGGGVLVNQAPHTLDVLCYLAGMPTQVWGWANVFGHDIECEDMVQAMFTYPNGAAGALQTNTVEAGSPQRLEIVGDRGEIVLSGEQLTVKHFAPSLSDFSATSAESFAAPRVEEEVVILPPGSGDHLAVHRDLFDAVVHEHRPRADGREALHSLELADAIIYSHFAGRPVSLPLDRGAYHNLLGELRSGKRHY